ncbi:MAG: GTP 3',8-cyclase MoaA [Chloroflexi bacterium]|nr:GTP 3',8-cyclase MoaA [Chloroflexota bacterium]
MQPVPEHLRVKDVLGRPLSDLRVSVTDRCNFRCPFCMPAELYGFRYHFLPRAEVLSFEEITRLTRIFVQMGVTKVRLTGGEPLLRSDVEKLVAQLAAVPGVEDLALTTNGYLLAQKAQVLRDAGLQRITVSLHTLDDDIFGRMNGRGFTTQRVLDGIRKAAEVGLAPVKINVVVQKGVNDDTLVELARFCKDAGYTVRFIEYMDVGNLNGWRMDEVVSADEIVQRLAAELPIEPVERGYGDVALRYRYKDGKGELGVIASVTRPFCGDCDRVRLSADGKVYTCLFADQGHDLKGPLRAGASDDEIKAIITSIWSRRTDRYSEERAFHTTRARKEEMFRLGG